MKFFFCQFYRLEVVSKINNFQHSPVFTTLKTDRFALLWLATRESCEAAAVSHDVTFMLWLRLWPHFDCVRMDSIVLRACDLVGELNNEQHMRIHTYDVSIPLLLVIMQENCFISVTSLNVVNVVMREKVSGWFLSLAESGPVAYNATKASETVRLLKSEITEVISVDLWLPKTILNSVWP